MTSPRIRGFRFSLKTLFYFLSVIGFLLGAFAVFFSSLPTTYWVTIDRKLCADNDFIVEKLWKNDHVEIYVNVNGIDELVVSGVRIIECDCNPEFGYFKIPVSREQRLRLWKAWFWHNLQIGPRGTVLFKRTVGGKARRTVRDSCPSSRKDETEQ